MAIMAATAAPVRASRALRGRDFRGCAWELPFVSGVGYRSLADWRQVLAGEPGQGVVGDLTPSVVEDERVAAVGEYVVVGDRGRAGVEVVSGSGHDLGHGMVMAAADDQQGPAVRLPGVDGRRGRLLEVRGRGLEERLARAGDGVPVVKFVGFVLGQGVAEAVTELL